MKRHLAALLVPVFAFIVCCGDKNDSNGTSDGECGNTEACAGNIEIGDTGESMLDAISNCEDIDGSLAFVHSELTSIHLPCLSSGNGGIYFDHNEELEDISLDNLSTVSANADRNGDLYFVSNDGLTDISLPSLSAVAGLIDFHENTGLTTISLPVLTTVGDSLGVYNSPSLATIDLSSLTTVDGNLGFSECQSLTPQLPLLVSVGGELSISGVDSLVDLSGYPNLVSVGGVYLSSNDRLENLDSLSGLVSTPGCTDCRLSFSSNPALTSVRLPGLTGPVASLRVVSNDSLAAIDLSGLTAIDGSLEIHDNPHLAEAELSGLTSVAEDVPIYRNESLAVLTTGLENIGGYLTIQSTALTGLGSFATLISVGGDLEIRSNPSLTSLSSLSNLQSIGGQLTIRDNPCLNEDEAMQFASRLDPLGGSYVVDNGSSYPCH